MSMIWKNLITREQVADIIEESQDHPVIILKHSTICSLSFVAKDRLERDWDEHEMDNIQSYLLDIISNRDISNYLAEIFGIPHQSPQLLLIHRGECIYDTSHLAISYRELWKQISDLRALRS